MSTIFDVAARAGVGVGTVSRVLNNSPLVSDKTRERVSLVIAELDYRPNSAARALSLGKTNTIGVIAPFFTTASVAGRLRGIDEVISLTGYGLMLLNVETPEQRRQAFERTAAGYQMDGTIVVSLSPGPEAPVWSRPVVFVDVREEGTPSLYIDNREGGKLAAYHLLGLGHRRIGFVGDLEDTAYGFTSSADRRRGCEEALREAGSGFRPGHIQLGPHGQEDAHRMARALLEKAERPTAIFAASDDQALGVLYAARSAGLRVPEDLSVIGFDDIEMAAYAGLTTVHQPLVQSGRLAARALLDLLSGNAAGPTEERLETVVMVRNTTAPPPAAKPEMQTGDAFG